MPSRGLLVVCAYPGLNHASALFGYAGGTKHLKPNLHWGQPLRDSHATRPPFGWGPCPSEERQDRHLATGDYAGGLALWDLENMKKPIWSPSLGRNSRHSPCEQSHRNTVGTKSTKLFVGIYRGSIIAFEQSRRKNGFRFS